MKSPSPKQTASYLILGLCAILLLAPTTAPCAVQSPDAFFGHPLGADRTLVSYDESLGYFRHLAQGSSAVELHSAGKTLEGRELVYMVISSPDNLARLDQLRDLSTLYHHPQGVTPQELEDALGEGKTVLMVTSAMHSDEIISSQMVLEWAYRLASGQFPRSTTYLNDVVVLLFPCLNPDGQVLVTDWYKEHLGTEFEGSSLPWLYHRYAGHSINRDWFMFNLPETRAVNEVFKAWWPQVVVDVHQMGITGPRIFVPPYADPVSDRVHPLIHRGAALFGANMALQLEQAGKRGVVDGYFFDAYWPGGLRSTPWWKNTVGILVEAASCRLATPVYINSEDLEGGHKGLADYQPQVNFPNPWPGGWWRPRDILEYQMLTLDAALETAAMRRRDLLANRVIMSQAAMHADGDAAGYVIPRRFQEDQGAAEHLIALLADNGVVFSVTQEEASLGDLLIPRGSVFVPAAQPLRPFLREMLEAHPYREVRPTLGSRFPLRPYDVTAWDLPEMMGVTVWKVDSPPNAPLGPTQDPEWPPAVADSVKGTHWWSLSPKENDSYRVVWRLLGADVEMYQDPSASPTVEAGRFWFRLDAEDLRRHTEDASLGRLRMESPPTLERLTRLRLPRVAVYLPWNPNADSGWLSWVLDEYGIPYASLNRFAVDENLSREADVMLLPDLGVEELVQGHAAFGGTPKDPRPSPYNGGLGREGVAALRAFVEQGGMLVTLGESSRLALTEFDLPVHGLPINSDLPDTPGVLVETLFDPEHPLAYGMPARGTTYHTQSPAFTAKWSRSGNQYHAAGWYSRNPRAVSGWGRDLHALSRKGALVLCERGEGSVVVMGFRPYFRGQATRTFKILFNTLLMSAAEPPAGR